MLKLPHKNALRSCNEQLQLSTFNVGQGGIEASVGSGDVLKCGSIANI